MVKINVISGFLGAGKTTLIKKLLTGKLREEKVILLENEYGEVGVDGCIKAVLAYLGEIELLNEQLNDESLATDFQKMTELTEALAARNRELEETMESWEALAEEVHNFEE